MHSLHMVTPESDGHLI